MQRVRLSLPGLVPAIHARYGHLTSPDRLGAAAEWAFGTSPRATTCVVGCAVRWPQTHPVTPAKRAPPNTKWGARAGAQGERLDPHIPCTAVPQGGSVVQGEQGRMIVSFRDEWLRVFFVNDRRSKNIPPDLESRLFRKLQMIDDVAI